MTDIFLIVLPVFLTVGVGYAAARTGLLPITAVDGLMKFVMTFAIPCLLFRAVSRLDLAEVFVPDLLLSFYLGAIACFGLGILGARLLFQRDGPDSVVIGFGSLFSNCFLLGIPIMERAYGSDALAPNFAIIAIHSPLCYLIGISAMEMVRAKGKSASETVKTILKAMFRNPLIVGLALGFVVNLSGLTIPGPVMEPVDMLAGAALPVALFGLGGVLTRCQVRRSVGAASMVAVLSLIVHPGLVFLLGQHVFHLSEGFLRSAVVTAAMPTGINAYVFATIYDRATGASASAVLIATAGSVITAAVWLLILGPA